MYREAIPAALVADVTIVMGDPIVATTAGRVRGLAVGADVLAFKGVPYGATTAGARDHSAVADRARSAAIRHRSGPSGNATHRGCAAAELLGST